MVLSDKEMVLGMVLLVAVIGLMIVGGDLAGKAFDGISLNKKANITPNSIADSIKVVSSPSLELPTEEFTGVIGDVNGDNTVNILDMVNLVNTVTETLTTSCSSQICAGDLTYLLHNENIIYSQELGLDLMDVVWLSNCLIDFSGTCENIIPGCMNPDSTFYNEDANMNCCCSDNFLSTIIFPTSPTNVYSGSQISFSIELSFNFEGELPADFNQETFTNMFNEGIDENIFSFQLLDELSDYDNPEYFHFLGISHSDETYKKIYNFAYTTPEVKETSSGRLAITINIDNEWFNEYVSLLADFDEDGTADYITIKVNDEEEYSSES